MDDYPWSSRPESTERIPLVKAHCYDRELQEKAFEWFAKHLRPGKKRG